MKKFLLVLAILGCTTLVSLTLPETAHARNRALLIGIGDYPYVSKLVGQQNDVDSMRKLLINKEGFQANEIITLLDRQATYAGIVRAFQRLKNETQAGDRVVFYFSGHGIQIDDASGDEADGKDETLIAYDASYSGHPTAPFGSALNLITDDQLKVWFDGMSDRRVEVIVDACYSGTITRAPLGEHGVIPKQPFEVFSRDGSKSFRFKSSTPMMTKKPTPAQQLVAPGNNRQVWTAASADELAFVDTRNRSDPRSVFTAAYVEGAVQRDLKGQVLFGHVKQASRNYCNYVRGTPKSGQVCNSLTPTFTK